MIITMKNLPAGKTGKVGSLSVEENQTVKAGDELVQIELGKANRAVKAEADGTILKILVAEGDSVVLDQPLFEMEVTAISADQVTNYESDKKTTQIDRDLVIVGSGPGGYVAAIYAAKKGLKVTMIEKDKLGGTCLNWGCIPTKSLVKSAEVNHYVHNSELFGVMVEGNSHVDMEKVIARKDDVVQQLVSGIDFLMSKNKIEVIQGKASFINNRQLLITNDEETIISFKDCIIATGSSISNVPIPGINQAFVLNSTQALEDTNLPKSITIVGGGVIGMEFAFIYRKLGVEVSVVEFLDRLVAMVDADVSKELTRQAKKLGINIYTSAKVTNIQQATNNQAIVTYEDRKGEHLIVSEKVLVAVGRHPNIEGLSIENTNIALNENKRGIQVNKHMKTNVDHVYAIGDVTDIIQLAHVASHQGIIAVDNILNVPKEMNYQAVPNVIFTSPEIATVGVGEDQAIKLGIEYEVSKASFKSNGKALTQDQTAGFIKLIKDKKTNKIIGGSIIGADASSLISALTLAVEQGVTAEELMETIFAHPTTGEVIHEAAFGLGIGALHQA